MHVFLDVERRDRRLTTPIITADMVSVVLETTGGPLLRLVSTPPPGILPEAHTRDATASGMFTFETESDTKLQRAIVFLRGKWAEFQLI